MKNIRKEAVSSCVNMKVRKDAIFYIFSKLLVDLGIPDRIQDDLKPLIEARDHLGLLSYLSQFEPQCMLKALTEQRLDSSEFFALYQLSAFLKKYPFKGIDTQEAARKKFMKAEESCRLFNHENFQAIVNLNEKHPDFYGVIEEMREDILSVLGEFPATDEIFGKSQHGPGVSLGDGYKEGRTTSFYKWSTLPYTVTQGASELAKTAILSDPQWIGALDDWYRRENNVCVGGKISMTDFWSRVLSVVDSSKITYVPKTALTDRTIAIEPLLNVFLQLGVDRVIRRDLRSRWGYDLNDQTRNQELAKVGSVSGELATVDLSAASDTISLMVCYLLLPPSWLDLLLDLRTPQGSMVGLEGPVVFEKISSMGNGFTFALESLIFGAIVRCAIRRTKSEKVSAVYGDDLIVPTTAYPYLLSMLQLFGFGVNVDKTFASGPFRESCGKDFISGHNVRPVFVTSTVSNLTDLFYIHNSLWLLKDQLCWAWGFTFEHTLEAIRKMIPKNIRNLFYGQPSEVTDAYLFSSNTRIRSRIKNKFSGGQSGYWRLIARPKAFRCQGYDFFFRKLMVRIRDGGPIPSFSTRIRKQRFNKGNAFTITRRDRIKFDAIFVEDVQHIFLSLIPVYGNPNRV